MNLTAKQIFYAALAALGVVATWYYNFQFIEDSGGVFSVNAFIAASYANAASSSIANDIGVAVLTFLVWSFHEARKLGMKHWWLYIVITFAVAFACAYPLFLFMRERRLVALGR